MDYDTFKIKNYTHWDLFLHDKQYPYLGRCYAWARREDAQTVVDMTAGEGDELFNIIVPAWNQAISHLFQHDWPNLAILGNTSPHLHAHLIPRYHSPRHAYGIEFIDPNPTGNYAPYPKKTIDPEILLEIKESIGSIL